MIDGLTTSQDETPCSETRYSVTTVASSPSQRLADALCACHESEMVDFKQSLDIAERGELLEVVKDIIAMANSGGGVILIGVNDDGTPSGYDVSAIVGFDPAKMTDQLFSATGRHFSGFHITSADKDGQTIASIIVDGVSVPLVVIAVGNYVHPQTGRQKVAYAQGVVYFRHGAKSEPGTTEDLERFLAREIKAVRELWLSNLRKVVEAPPGSHVVVLSPGQATLSDRVNVRVVDDSEAIPVKLHEQDWRKQYPHSYAALTEAMRRRYTDFKQSSGYHDIRKSLELDARYCSTRYLDPDSPRGGSKRFYSEAIFAIFDQHYTRSSDE